MPRTKSEARASGAGSIERLCSATLSVWSGAGLAGISARSIAELAGTPTSSIYHHFGDLDGLFLTAQDHAHRAAEAWCERQLAALPHQPLAPTSLPSLMAQVIDDWCSLQRPLAFAWHQCQLLAAHDERFRAPERAWDRLWSEFWNQLCRQFGCEEYAELTACLADSETLYHLIDWNRPLDRCSLDELTAAWGSWLSGKMAGEGFWRNCARTLASSVFPRADLRNELAEKIADAGVTLLAERGTAALTHRTVAEKAGVSLGLVSYNFKTSADLLSATFSRFYEKTNVLPLNGAVHPDDLVNAGVRRRGESAIEAMTLAAARDPQYAVFGAQLRYGRGRRAGPSLASLIDCETVTDLDAAIFSGLLGGRLRRSAHADEQAFRTTLEAELALVRARLAVA